MTGWCSRSPATPRSITELKLNPSGTHDSHVDQEYAARRRKPNRRPVSPSLGKTFAYREVFRSLEDGWRDAFNCVRIEPNPSPLLPSTLSCHLILNETTRNGQELLHSRILDLHRRVMLASSVTDLNYTEILTSRRRDAKLALHAAILVHAGRGVVFNGLATMLSCISEL